MIPGEILHADPPVVLNSGRPVTRLVVIGRDLDRAAIERSFQAFCGVARTVMAAPASTR